MPIRLLVFVAVCCVCLTGCEAEDKPSEGDAKISPAGKEIAMVLILSSGDQVANPTDDEIREFLGRLNVGRDGEGFAILRREKMTYVQVSGDKAIGFDMEYQEGDVQKHYRAKREGFTLGEVVRALSEYRDGTIDWSDYGDWSRITW